MHIIGKYTVRTILDEIVAVPLGSSSESFNGILSLNPVGQVLFELLAQERTEEELVRALTEEYEVDAQTAQSDVQEFLASLRQGGLLAE